MFVSGFLSGVAFTICFQVGYHMMRLREQQKQFVIHKTPKAPRPPPPTLRVVK